MNGCNRVIDSSLRATDYGAVADWQLAAPAVVTGNGTNWVGSGLSVSVGFVGYR